MFTSLDSVRIYEENDSAVYEGVLHLLSDLTQDYLPHLHIIQSDHLIAYQANDKNGMMLYSIKIRFATLETLPATSNPKFPAGFSIRSDGKKFHFYCTSLIQLNSWLTRLRRYCYMTNWQANYNIVKELANGKNSHVYLMEHKSTNVLVVGKMIKKELFVKHPSRLRNVKNETAIMGMIQSDLVVRFIEAYQDEKCIMIVMEYLPGGTLYERILKKRKYSEKEAASIMKQLLEALGLLHRSSILHRDVKLDNIFMVSDADDLRIKLGDFDLANLVKHISHTKQTGTPGYMAPEIFMKELGGYTPKTDVFSSGVVLYTLLTGTFPYRANNMKELYERNQEGKLVLPEQITCNMSRECLELVKLMLEPIPSKRLSIEGVLKHPFMLKHTHGMVVHPQKILLADEEDFNADDMDEMVGVFSAPFSNMKGRELARGEVGSFSKLSGVSSNNLALPSFYKKCTSNRSRTKTPAKRSLTTATEIKTSIRRIKSIGSRSSLEGEIDDDLMKEAAPTDSTPMQNLKHLMSLPRRFMND